MIQMDELSGLWDRLPHDKMGRNYSIDELESLMRPRIKKNSFVFTFFLWFGLLIVLTTTIFLMLNIPGYLSNPPMIATIGLCLGLTTAFTCYGIFQLTRLRRMNLCNSELASQLRMKLRFFRTHYRIWMIILAFSTLLLSFAVNILVDNTDGHYVINSPSTYALIYSVLFVFLYAMLEAAHVPVTGDLRAYLWDLERQVLEETARIEKNYRVRFFLAIAVLLVITSLMIYVILRQLAAM